MSDTPRTDTQTYQHCYTSLLPTAGGPWVLADFARQLERDLAQRTAEVAALKAERDEARRSACGFKARYMDSRIGFSPMTDDEVDAKARQIAARMGWDCFKEANP
jgi:hypothetical protein